MEIGDLVVPDNSDGYWEGLEEWGGSIYEVKQKFDNDFVRVKCLDEEKSSTLTEDMRMILADHGYGDLETSSKLEMIGPSDKFQLIETD